MPVILIKNEITVAFGRDEDNKAQQYAVLAQGQGYEPVQKLKVEPMTLKALVRERIEAGQICQRTCLTCSQATGQK